MTTTTSIMGIMACCHFKQYTIKKQRRLAWYADRLVADKTGVLLQPPMQLALWFEGLQDVQATAAAS